MSDGQFIERATLDYWSDRDQEQRDRIKELEAECRKWQANHDTWQAMAKNAEARNEELDTKLEKAVEALKGAAKQHRIIAGMDLMGASAVAYNAARAAESTTAELKGEKDE